MKKTYKLLILTISFMFSITSCFALSTGKLDRAIKGASFFDSATVAISVKNADNDSIVYQNNEKKMLHPASTLKLFTAYSAIETLGYDYYFKTQFYKDSNNNLYIKLGADPILTSKQLQNAFNTIKASGKSTYKNIYFDDSIIDKKEFSPGWMWDDDINSFTPKVSAYNLDGNVITVNLTPSSNGMSKTEIKTGYPISVINFIKSASKVNNSLDIARYNWINPEVVELYGTISKPISINIPISSMRRYYIYNVEKAMDTYGIKATGTSFSSKLVPNNAQLITEINNPITAVMPSILQNSNNLMAETIYKLAGGSKYNSTGTDNNAGAAFFEFYKKLGIDAEKIIVRDGCGVSRYNLIYTDWMTSALNKIYKAKDFQKYKENMAQTGDGTLSNRLYDLRGEAWLKTGSLSNISAISGYIKSKDGHTYSIAMIIQNFTDEQSKIKEFEDSIIKIIYNK